MWCTWVRSLIQEDLPSHGATKPTCRSYWACALEPRATAAEPTPRCPRSTARGATAVSSPHPRTREQPHSRQLERSPHSNRDPAHPEIKGWKKFFKRIIFTYKLSKLLAVIFLWPFVILCPCWPSQIAYRTRYHDSDIFESDLQS